MLIYEIDRGRDPGRIQCIYPKTEGKIYENKKIVYSSMLGVIVSLFVYIPETVMLQSFLLIDFNFQIHCLCKIRFLLFSTIFLLWGKFVARKGEYKFSNLCTF